MKLDKKVHINVPNQCHSSNKNQEKSEVKNGFSHPIQLFKYQVMLFRLSNILASFQGYIKKILAKNFNIFFIVYLNDIVIYTKNLGQSHVEIS